jgi:diguanylate cyclase (GGDEF)-like protein
LAEPIVPESVRLAKVLAELATAVAADGGAALYLDDGDGALSLAATSGPASAGRSWSSRLLRRSPDSRVLVAPLPDWSGGVIVLERAGSADFTRDDRALVNLYARQLTDELPAAAAFRQSGWSRQLEAIQRIAAQLTRLASVEEVGAAICRETRQVTDYDEAHVLLVHEGRLRQVAAVSGSGSAAAPAPLQPDSPAGLAINRAFASSAPLLVPESVEPAAGRGGAWSLLVTPLRYEGRVSGVVVLLKAGVGRYDDDDVRLLGILSDQAAVAFENAKLLAGSNELVREMSGLLDVTTTANDAKDEHTLATLLALKVRTASQMDGCAIWRWHHDSTTLRALAADQVAQPPSTDAADHPGRRAVLRDGRPRLVQVETPDSAAAVAASDSTLVVSAARGAEAQLLDQLGYRSMLILPMLVGGRPTGLIELYSRSAERHVGAAEMQAFLTMAGSVASGLENARLLEQLQLAADIDPLTGVNNHRYLQDRLRQETARAARSRSPLCVLMLDLDKFKPINDRFGHAEGDRLLRSVAAAIRAQVRTNDIVARYGGDEFVVIMPDTPEDRAHEVARRVVAGILARRHELSNGELVSIGASAGLAVHPGDGRTAAALLQIADARMYEAKRGQVPDMPPIGEPALAPTIG